MCTSQQVKILFIRTELGLGYKEGSARGDWGRLQIPLEANDIMFEMLAEVSPNFPEARYSTRLPVLLKKDPSSDWLTSTRSVDKPSELDPLKSKRVERERLESNGFVSSWSGTPSLSSSASKLSPIPSPSESLDSELSKGLQSSSSFTPSPSSSSSARLPIPSRSVSRVR